MGKHHRDEKDSDGDTQKSPPPSRWVDPTDYEKVSEKPAPGHYDREHCDE